MTLSYPDAPSGCCSSMYLNKSSECNMFFIFYNLRMHSDGLYRKMTKIFFFLCFGGKIAFLWFWQKIFLRFWRKSSFLRFWLKTVFSVFAGKCVFAVLERKCIFSFFGGKMHFCDFGEKMNFCDFVFLAKKCFFFTVLTGKYVFTVLAEKYGFTGLAKKCVFMEMCVFTFFTEKQNFAVLTRKCVFRFDGKMHFWVLAEKLLLFLEEVVLMNQMHVASCCTKLVNKYSWENYFFFVQALIVRKSLKHPYIFLYNSILEKKLFIAQLFWK